MRELVHRLAPLDPRHRLLVAGALTVIGAPAFGYGLLALLVPIQQAVFLGYVQSVVLLAVGALLLAVAKTIGSGVAAEAAAAPESANPVRRVNSSGDASNRNGTDPVGTLQARYARGELDDREFDRRMELLLESDERSTAGDRDRLSERTD